MPNPKRMFEEAQMVRRVKAYLNNMNIMLALTIHTRAALDLGLVQITLQELQHQHPQLTSRIRRLPGREETFHPMELPVLPLDQELLCTDML